MCASTPRMYPRSWYFLVAYLLEVQLDGFNSLNQKEEVEGKVILVFLAVECNAIDLKAFLEYY